MTTLQQAQIDQLRRRFIVLMYRHENNLPAGTARDAVESHANQHYQNNQKFRRLITELVDEAAHLVKAHPNATSDLPPVVPARDPAVAGATFVQPVSPAQPKPHARTRLFVCLTCSQEKWTSQIPAGSVAECEHGHGPMEERFPERVDLTAEDRGLLHWISDTLQISHGDALAAGLDYSARNLAEHRARKGQKIPQWLADRLQKQPGGGNNPTQP